MTDGGKGTKGHKCSAGIKEKLRVETAKRKGKLCPNSKPVICDGVEYESLTSFEKINNVINSDEAKDFVWVDPNQPPENIVEDLGIY